MKNNVSTTLFNERILEKKLSSISTSSTPNYAEQYEEILKWKQLIETGNLLTPKESSLQGKFLTSVFEKILGYFTSLNANKDGEWNLVPEATTLQDASEADAALGFFTIDARDVRVVIELKDAGTDLDQKQSRASHLTPVEQAFGYAYKNGKRCVWVIVSNFKEIRLYRSSSSIEYERVLITELDDKQNFLRFIYLLSKENLISKEGCSKVDVLYKETEKADEEISEKFYADYTELRGQLFEALKKENPEWAAKDEVLLFEKAQKILDRFIFICFCEDKDLLPEETTSSIWRNAQRSFSLEPNEVWRQLNGLFRSIDRGNERMKVTAYNGGLFSEDDVLDNLIVPDEVLLDFKKLSDYDFDSDLNVNILGHIFEQSIPDIEQIKAEIRGETTDRKQSQRKKEGVYYTPDYVTRYIVEKTVGRWMEDTRQSVKESLFSGGGFKAFLKGKKKPILLTEWQEIPETNSIQRDATIQMHLAYFNAYSERLKQLRVLDPACGSGAFLIAAFSYILAEIEHVAEMLCTLRGGEQDLFDINKSILQNNLHGVDINKESVEITKLSLWLQTAQRGKTLVSLDGNIKVGNSLISDPAVAGNLAFDWNTEFKEVMDAGGFDVVIGNPPYGASLSKTEKAYLSTNYTTTEYNYDTYKAFMERGLNLTKPNGYMGCITPNTYFVLENGANRLRKFLFNTHTLLNLVELFNVFPAAIVEPSISVYRNSIPDESESFEVISIPRKTTLSSTFVNDGTVTLFTQSSLKEKEGYWFNFRENGLAKKVRTKIEKISRPLSEFFTVTTGIKPYQIGKGNPPQTEEVVKSRPFNGRTKEDNHWIPYMKAGDVRRYTNAWDGEYVKYGIWLAEANDDVVYLPKKLLVRQTADYPIASYFDGIIMGNNSLHYIYYFSEKKKEVSLKYLMGVINSKLMKWVYQHDNFHMVKKPLACVKKVFLDRLPISFKRDTADIEQNVDRILLDSQSLYDKTHEFTKYLTSIYKPKSITGKLEKFYALTFKEFIDELRKQKVKLSPAQEMELMPLFDTRKVELATLSQTIQKLEDGLDSLIYQIYGLSADEIKLVEDVTAND